MIPRYSSDDRTYSIIRFFADPSTEAITLKTGATIEEAKAWCANPETSSETCTGEIGRWRTEIYGPWFDGWTVEE